MCVTMPRRAVRHVPHAPSLAQVVGDGRCPVIDNWWQTETGSMMLTPLPGSWCKLKPGSASLPFFGVQPVVLDPNTGKELEVRVRGEGGEWRWKEAAVR